MMAMYNSLILCETISCGITLRQLLPTATSASRHVSVLPHFAAGFAPVPLLVSFDWYSSCRRMVPFAYWCCSQRSSCCLRSALQPVFKHNHG